MKEFDEVLSSNTGCKSAVAVVILCIKKDFRYGILKSFEENFHQGIKFHIIYFSLTVINNAMLH